MREKKDSKQSEVTPSSLVDSLRVSLEEIWPQEREVIERPDRLKYVRKLAHPTACVFCEAASAQVGFESLKVYETAWSQVVLNKYPYNTGHLLVLPLRHCGDLMDLTVDEYADLSQLLKLSLGVLKKAYTSQGFNIGLNHGSVAGAGIPDHLHWHIIPRWAGDTNFFPLIAETKVLPETLEQSFERLKPYFEKMD